MLVPPASQWPQLYVCVEPYPSDREGANYYTTLVSATRVGMYEVFSAEGLRPVKTSDDQGIVFASAQQQPPEVALALKQALIDRQYKNFVISAPDMTLEVDSDGVTK